MNLICLDIEATDNGEMLELSIINHADSRTVYQSYFHPVTARSWPNSQAVHHITPAMVKDAPTVKKERRKIQTLVNAADGIIGFAVDNDIRYLNSNDIPVREDIKVIDVRDWFWYYKGKQLDIEFGNVPRLAKCAELLGFEFSEESEAHSAANDTLMTIKLFNALLEEARMDLPLEKAIDRFEELFEEERRLYAEKMAHGFISLVRTPKGYLLRNAHQHPASDAECSIEVAGRFQAEHDLREKFSNRTSASDPGYYDLRKSDIEFFKAYSNEYDAEKEEFYRHLVKAKKKAKTGLNMLFR
ncbi:MAG: 3'-5' exonuclease [Muribaculaceae bacterium]|nr:3'-5' exonuclease [Muribaculaceae bacterium]